MPRQALLAAAALLTATAAAGAEPVALFDGKSFAGWDGDTKETWRIEDGCIVGGSLAKKQPRNQFLATAKGYKDFTLRLKFKLLGDPKKGFVNSGVQVRSQRVPNDTEMVGYQADLGDPSWWGSIYDESRRNRVLAQSDMKKIDKVLKRGDWNDYEVRCEGRRIRTYINGVLAVDYTEKDEKIPQEGRIGLQIHSGGPAEVWFKDITVEELPAPPARPKEGGVRATPSGTDAAADPSTGTPCRQDRLVTALRPLLTCPEASATVPCQGVPGTDPTQPFANGDLARRGID